MSSWKFWAAFGVGVAAGAALALIYAPQTGARTRRQLRRNWEDASDYVRGTASTVSEQAGKYIKRGKEAVDDLGDQAGKYIKRGKGAVDDLSEQAQTLAGKAKSAVNFG